MEHAPYCRIPADWMADPSQCWYDWQSLLAGLLAIVAAFVGAMAIYCQTRQSKIQEGARLRRRHNAVRHALPVNLSEILSFLQNVMRDVFSNQNMVVMIGGPNIETCGAARTLSDGLTDFIESTDDSRLIEASASLIRRLQVLESNIITLRQKSGIYWQGPSDSGNAQLRQNELDELIVRAGQAHALTESLFKYALDPKMAPIGNVDWDDVRRAFSLAQIEVIDGSSLAQLITLRERDHPSVWPEAL